MEKKIFVMFCMVSLFAGINVKADKYLYIDKCEEDDNWNKLHTNCPDCESGVYKVDGDGNIIYGVSGEITGGSGGVCSSEDKFESSCKFNCAIGNNKYYSGEANEYCRMYCTSDNTFTYPGFVPTVPQGSRFTWTINQANTGPLFTLTTTKNCVIAFD